MHARWNSLLFPIPNQSVHCQYIGSFLRGPFLTLTLGEHSLSLSIGSLGAKTYAFSLWLGIFLGSMILGKWEWGKWKTLKKRDSKCKGVYYSVGLSFLTSWLLLPPLPSTSPDKLPELSIRVRKGKELIQLALVSH